MPGNLIMCRLQCMWLKQERLRKLEETLNKRASQSNAQLASVSAAITQLISSENIDQTITETGTVVDTQLCKAQAFIKHLVLKSQELEKVFSIMSVAVLSKLLHYCLFYT